MTRFEKAMLVLGGLGAAATLAVMAVQHRLSPPQRAPVELANPRPCDKLDLRKDFGAAGDGIADDTTAVQQYLNRATDCRRTAYFPPGTFRIRGTIRLPNDASVYGGNFVKLDSDGAEPIFYVPSETTGAMLWRQWPEASPK